MTASRQDEMTYQVRHFTKTSGITAVREQSVAGQIAVFRIAQTTAGQPTPRACAASSDMSRQQFSHQVDDLLELHPEMTVAAAIAQVANKEAHK